MTKNFLFVCSQNRLRSPTAEEVFSTYPGLNVASAGTDGDAETPVTPELLEWADLIFVMEERHRQKLSRNFQSSLKDRKIICLNIPDRYEFMEESLVRLLKSKLRRFLPGG